MKTLPEILIPLAQECWRTGNRNKALSISGNYGTTFIPTVEAIAKELMGCLPEKMTEEKGYHGYAERFAHNQALDEVRARLTAFIGKDSNEDS